MSRLLCLCLAVAAYSPAARAFPALYAQLPDTCKGPSEAHLGHGAPEVSDDLVFTLTTQLDGSAVTSWTPGTAYVLDVSHPLLGNMYIHTTAGNFSDTVAPSLGSIVTAEGCNLRAWVSNSLEPRNTKELNWTAPSCCTAADPLVVVADSVTMQATFAEGQMNAFQQAEVVFPGDVTACVCEALVVVPEPVMPLLPVAPIAAPAPAADPALEAAPAPPVLTASAGPMLAPLLGALACAAATLLATL